MLQFSLAGGRFRRELNETSMSLQIEIVSKNEATELAYVAENVIDYAEDVAVEVKKALGDGASVGTDVAVSQPPQKPETPPPAETIADKLGIDNIRPDSNVAEFLDNVEEILGQSLDTIKTAEETEKEKQDASDAADQPIVYKTPTRMEIQSQPTQTQAEL